jgi:hypothetical protein
MGEAGSAMAGLRWGKAHSSAKYFMT